MTDSMVTQKGMKALNKELGLVGAGRFISLLMSEPFDYTEWRRDKFEDLSLKELCDDIRKFKKQQSDKNNGN